MDRQQDVIRRITAHLVAGMSDPIIAFITYTKGPVQYVTSPEWETKFLNWLNSVDSSAGYTRETFTRVGIRCSPVQVHAVEKKEAIVLSLVGKTATE